MVGLLKGGAKALFGELLTPLYLDASLKLRSTSYGADGSVRAGGGAVACKAKVDSATTRMRDAEGYTETDRAIYILASSVDIVTTDYQITISEGPYAGETFHIATVDRPPGGSYWLCRGTRRG